MKLIENINRLRILKQDANLYMGDSPDKFKFVSWYHSVGDCLESIIGYESFIISGYYKIIDGEPLLEVKEKDIKDYTKLIIEFIDSVINFHSKDISFDETNLKEDVDKVIRERVKKSHIVPIFSAWTIAILIFAILGIFRIKSIEIDINKFADSKREEIANTLCEINKKYEKAISQIASSNTELIIEERESSIKSMRSDIFSDFTEFINEKKYEYSPLLKQRVDSSLIEVGKLENQIGNTKRLADELVESYNVLDSLRIIRNDLNYEVPNLLNKYSSYKKQQNALIVLFAIFIFIQLLMIVLIRKKKSA